MKFSKSVFAVALLAFLMAPHSGPAQVAVDSYSADAPEDVNYFYTDLSPYGQWVDLEGYGWCWQPSVLATNPQWQPYCDAGHWEYTDAGWFWQSDYPWGWAPFHYGRWLHHEQSGWVWFPDRVWGPAWVTWRMAGDDCGWAPLPLHATFDEHGGCLFNGVAVGANFDFGLPVNCFAFVALDDFCAPDLGRHRLGQPDAERIYGHTTVVNNYRFANKSIFNGGIPVSRVASVTHADLRPIPIRDEPAGGAREGGPGAVAYRRTPQRPENIIPVRAQKVDERHPVIQHASTAAVKGEHSNMTPETPARPVETAPIRTPAHVEQKAPGAGKPVEIVGPEPTDWQVAKPPGTLATHTTRSKQVADQAHALPPLFRPHDEPAPEPPATPMPHVPRSQQVANEAHALPPLKEAPPPTELAKPGNPHPDAVSSPRDKAHQPH
jgi:hypothetical protein